jgi:hypothetical protein
VRRVSRTTGARDRREARERLRGRSGDEDRREAPGAGQTSGISGDVPRRGSVSGGSQGNRARLPRSRQLVAEELSRTFKSSSVKQGSPGTRVRSPPRRPLARLVSGGGGVAGNRRSRERSRRRSRRTRGRHIPQAVPRPQVARAPLSRRRSIIRMRPGRERRRSIFPPRLSLSSPSRTHTPPTPGDARTPEQPPAAHPSSLPRPRLSTFPPTTARSRP